jgi:hypothetical protein
MGEALKSLGIFKILNAEIGMKSKKIKKIAMPSFEIFN